MVWLEVLLVRKIILDIIKLHQLSFDSNDIISVQIFVLIEMTSLKSWVQTGPQWSLSEIHKVSIHYEIASFDIWYKYDSIIHFTINI